jgi:hypothetical protein
MSLMKIHASSVLHGNVYNVLELHQAAIHTVDIFYSHQSWFCGSIGLTQYSI